MAKAKSTSETLPVPADEAELQDLCQRLTLVSIEREQLIAERDLKMQEAAEPFLASIGAHGTTIEQGMKALHSWAVLHKDRFVGAQSVVVGGQFRLGWHPGNWETKLKSRVTWDSVVAALAELITHGAKTGASKVAQLRATLAAKYLRPKTEPNKQAMLTDRENEDAAELLADVGVRFIREKSFYLAPNREGQESPKLSLEVKE